MALVDKDPAARKPTAAPARDPRRAQFEANKLAKRLQRQVGEAIADYSMIEAGDRVMVCLSGGKDSYGLLDVLLALQRRSPVPFTLVAVNLDQKQPGFPADVLPRYLTERGVDFRIAEQDTYSVVKRLDPGRRDDVLAVLAPAPRRALPRRGRAARHQDRARPSSRRPHGDVLPQSLLRRQAEDDAAEARVRRRQARGDPSARLRARARPRRVRRVQAFPAHPVHAVRLAGEPAAQAGRRSCCGSGSASTRAASSRSSTRWARSRPRTSSTARSVDFAAIRATGRPEPGGDIAFDVDPVARGRRRRAGRDARRRNPDRCRADLASDRLRDRQCAAGRADACRLRPAAPRRRSRRSRAPALAAALRRGGYVLYLRHTSTDFGQNDDAMTDYANCAQQRNLTDAGRARGARDRRRAARVAHSRRRRSSRALTAGRWRPRASRSARRRYRQRCAAVPRRRTTRSATRSCARLLSTPVAKGSNLAIASHGNPFRAVAGPPLPRRRRDRGDRAARQRQLPRRRARPEGRLGEAQVALVTAPCSGPARTGSCATARR